MKTIVDGIAVQYSDEGTGPIVLLLHGWGDSLHTFDAVAGLLSHTYRLIRLDLPGFGQSELPGGTWDVEAYGRFVGAFCTKLNIEPAFAVGHSFGGRILIKALGNNIFSVQKMSLIASAGVADRPTLQNNVFTAIAKVGKIILKPFPQSWYLRLRRELYRVIGGDYVSAGALKDTFVRVINEDLSTDAARVQVPTLLIWGEDDIVTPVSEGKKLERMIQRSELQILKRAGHFVHQQKPEEVAELIKKFL